MAAWKKTTDPNTGSIYYYNRETRETQWDKPDGYDEDSPEDWRQADSDGKVYYYNVKTKETSWKMPEILQNAQNAQSAQSDLPPRPQMSAGPQGGRNYERRDNRDFRSNARDRPEHLDNLRAFVPARGPEQPYNSTEEAVAAFKKMLKRKGINKNSVWKTAILDLCSEDAFRALKDPKENRKVFAQYQEESKAEEEEREEDRLSKLKSDFSKMLRNIPDIKYFTRWSTALPMLQGETVFKQARSLDEAQGLFNDHVSDLQAEHKEETQRNRSEGISTMTKALEKLDLSLDENWPKHKQLMEAHETYQSNKAIQKLTNKQAFETYAAFIKDLEFDDAAASRQIESDKFRAGRQARDAIAMSIDEIKFSGKASKFKEMRVSLKSNPQYQIMLEDSEGSNPLDFYFDMLDKAFEEVRAKRKDAHKALEEEGGDMSVDLTRDDFFKAMRESNRSIADDPTWFLVFLHHYMIEVARQKLQLHEEEQLTAVDDFRHALGRLRPPIRTSDRWEDIQPLVQDLPEYAELDSDNRRTAAFDRFIRRLKKDSDRRRDDGRNRESSHRSHHHEVDAYGAERERAERERAQGQRSRQRARDPSPPLLGDSRHRHGHDDRRTRDRPHPRLNSDRADPRDESPRFLDYDDSPRGSFSGSALGRRRSRGEDEDTTSNKRARHRHTPEEAPKEPDYKSGSEEGEIEEA